MIYEYVLSTTDYTFDCGDYPATNYGWIEKNGFDLEIDKNDVINIKSLKPFGDCAEIMKDIKSLTDLKRFLTENFEFIENEYKEVINELLEFINENIKMEVKNGRTDLLSVG